MSSQIEPLPVPRARIYLFHPHPDTHSALDAQVLRPAGYEVETFPSLEKLVERLAAVPADLVLVASNPDEDPEFSVLKPVAQSSPDGAPPWPVIILATQALQNIPLSCLGLGLAGIVAAPYKSEEVLAAVAQVIHRRSPGQQRLDEVLAQAQEYARLYQTVERERSRYQNLLASIQDGILILDERQRFLLCNRAAAQFLNFDHHSCRGQILTALVKNKDLLDTLQQIDTRFPYQTEITLEDTRILSAQFTPVPEIGLAIVLHEITQLKNLDRIKSDFVNTVSHDLRSPLTAIMGYVELLHRVGPLNDQQRQFVERIQLSLGVITELINDLLDLGRIEAGYDTRLELIDPPALIETTLSHIAARLTEKDQRLEFHLQPDLPLILVSPIRLQQMLTNLLDNAHKYTPHGGKIALNVRQEHEQLIIQISDSGLGIPTADQPFIFDRFFRGSNVAGHTPGTGLGLAIVKSIVDLHHGRIWVESPPGQGSTFTIVLPIRARPA